MEIDVALRRKRELIGEIFPEGCKILYSADGSLSVSALYILNYAVIRESSGKSPEHPCYGCTRRADECDARQVNYHDEARRFVKR